MYFVNNGFLLSDGEFMTIEKNIRWKLRFDNYSKAYKSLKESIEAFSKDSNNRFIQDSVIQRYE